MADKLSAGISKFSHSVIHSCGILSVPLEGIVHPCGFPHLRAALAVNVANLQTRSKTAFRTLILTALRSEGGLRNANM
jgi:hypothetical protein